MLGPEDRIAIIGLHGRFAGAPSIDALASMLEAGRTGVAFFSDEELLAAGVPATLVADPRYVKARFPLDGADLFDAGFFSLTPREAALLDPQQRLFLEECWAALEDAGQAGERRRGRVGVFASASRSTYQLHLLRRLGEAAFEPFVLDGTLNDFMASRVSHKLDLRGPSLMIQSACSSSLHAVHLACQSLLTGESDLALAGASSITVPTRAGALAHEGGVTSPDGHCRAFDAGAAGTTGGDAVVVIVLKRLADALRDRDTLRAVVLGSAVNNDGAGRVSFTAPGVLGQTEVIRQAMAAACVSPGEIGYVEAHGSGTLLGDPVEIAALGQAFSEGVPRQSCPVGSLKPNIGHTDVAAGLAGLVKVVLGLERKKLFPTPHFQEPNPHIDFPRTPFYVQADLAPWPSRGGPRKAGVSSLGMGGSNAHVVLEEAPEPPERGPDPPWKLLVLSARSRPALTRMRTALAEHLRAHPEVPLADVAYSLQAGRAAFSHRATLVCRAAGDALRALEMPDERGLFTGQVEGSAPPVAFLFPGLGEPVAGWAASLYAQAPAFRAELDRGAQVLLPLLSLDVRDLLLAGGDPATIAPRDPFRALRRASDSPSPLLQQTRFAQPALLALELALLAFLRSLGLRPDAVIGHSLGDYAAAVAASVFSPDDALSLVAERARLMATLPKGALLALPLSPAEIAAIPAPGASLAAINGPRMSVVGGTDEALARLTRALAERGIASRRLPVEHAFHTEAMRPIAEVFAARVAAVPRHPPVIPCLSSLTGAFLDAEQAVSPAYWAEQLCQPVRFSAVLQTLLADPARVLVELGPGSTLTSLARLSAQAQGGSARVALSLLASEPGSEAPPWMEAIAALFRAGVSLDWDALDPEGKARRVPLPTYPFERSRHWVDGPEGPIAGSVTPVESPRIDPAEARPDEPRNPRETALHRAFQQAFGLARIGIHDTFFSLGGHSLLAIQLLHRIRKDVGLTLSVRDLIEHPTIAELATFSAGEPAVPEGPPLRARLDETRSEGERRALLEAYVTELLSHALGRPAEELCASDDLRAFGLSENLADLVLAVKRDLGRPVYAPEILASPSVSGLADLLLGIEQPAARIELVASPERPVELRSPSVARKNPRAAFVLSSARSGSTLLRVMLAGHPQLFSPPELHLLMYGSMREREARLPSAHFGQGLTRALMELGDRDMPRAERTVQELLAEDASIPAVYLRLQRLCAPRLLVDKSPSYAEQIETLRRAPQIFEPCVFLHLVRHPLAVIESYVRNRIDRLNRSASGDPWALGEEHWVRCNRNILDFLDEGPHPAHRLRFEDLVAAPEQSMSEVAAALGVPSSPELLRPYEGGRMIDGVGDPSIHEHERIEPSLGEVWKTIHPPRPLGPEARALAARLGYDPVGEG